MLPDRALLLAELLREMRTSDGGYFPDEAWLEIHKTFAVPYVEVVIPRIMPDGRVQAFLLRRDAHDPHWPGRPWHIPGGIWRVTDTLEEACDRLARRELGVRLSGVTEVASYKWTDHPYANPISHICLCHAVEAPHEDPSRRYVPTDAPPAPLLKHHGEFLGKCLDFLRRRNRGS